MSTQNPFTNRLIKLDGPTYRLIKKIQAQSSNFDEQKQIYLKTIHSKVNPKYTNIEDKYFCGSKGGYPSGTKTFPVDSEKRCRAALSYARNAPFPEGIRQCAMKIAKEKGWKCGTKKSNQ